MLGRRFLHSERATNRVQISPIEPDLLRTFLLLLEDMSERVRECFGRGLGCDLSLNYAFLEVYDVNFFGC